MGRRRHSRRCGGRHRQPVSYSETLQKAARPGVQPVLVDSRLDALGITISQFGRLDARLAAWSYRHGSAYREWLNLASQLAVEVRVIRGSAT